MAKGSVSFERGYFGNFEADRRVAKIRRISTRVARARPECRASELNRLDETTFRAEILSRND